MKKMIASAAALLCCAAFVSCDLSGIVTSTPSPNTTTPSKTPETQVQTISPITLPSTNDDITLTPTLEPTPTPSLTPTPTEPINKFDSYIASDFDITVDDSDPVVNYVECGKGVMVKGNLVIVNEKYGYNSKYTSSLASIREQREGNISVSLWSLQCTPETLRAIDALSTAYEIAFPDAERTIIVHSAFKNSSDLTTTAYSSEYLTGLSLKLLFWDGQYTYKIDNLEMKAEKQWLQNNCAKFGFVIRYGLPKQDITGVEQNSSDFRYVGIPHSYYMNEQGICLEEYNEKLKGYSFENRLLYTDPTGNSWELYYVQADIESGKTRIPVDKGADYTISGDNMGGFIVTVRKTDLKSIEFSRLEEAIKNLLEKTKTAFKATVTRKGTDTTIIDKYDVVMFEDSFKMEYLSNYTVVYKDAMLYLTDLEGNTDKTESNFDAACKKYLLNLGSGKSAVIVPSQESLDVGKIEALNGGAYLYTLHLIDRELVDAQNIAYFGKTGVMSNIVLKITVKDKQVIGYSVEGKISGGGIYSFDLEFLPTDGLKIDTPLEDDDLVDIF